MVLNPQQITTREKLILAGLYLSKYDKVGLQKLGFESFIEAFNALGYALGGKPASVKNYRDEFDPLFENHRKGWRNRPTRDYCMNVFEEYRELDLEAFSGLIKSFVGYDQGFWDEIHPKEKKEMGEFTFAKRLITGLAAEKYFQTMHPSLSQFKEFKLENTTQLGCGYDFRLRNNSQKDFLAVEVKGLHERTGGLSLTPKEYEAAASLTDRFFLFVVKNFRETPFHEIYQAPLMGPLKFKKKERVIVQVSWLTSI